MRALLGTAALAAAVAAVFTGFQTGTVSCSRAARTNIRRTWIRRRSRRNPPRGKARVLQRRRGRNRQRPPTRRSRALAIDGKVDASNAGDMLTQRLLGLLPVLLHPQPRDALVIGLGSGVTADAVLASGEIQHLDVVEISPEVVEASAYFDRENRGC